jgi:hypothetical protein
MCRRVALVRTDVYATWRNIPEDGILNINVAVRLTRLGAKTTSLAAVSVSVSVKDRRLPCAEDRCQGNKAAVSHFWGASVTTVNHPVEQGPNIGIAFKQKHYRLSCQLTDLQQMLQKRA